MRLSIGLISVIGTMVGLQSLATAAPKAAPPDDQATAELKEHHRHHHHGGVTQFIAMSLDTLGEDEAKRPQVEKVQDQLHACMAAAREGEKKVHLAIADGVEVGNVDTAKVETAIAQLGVASASIHDCSANALNELHAILSPAERGALVHKVQAHWAVWRHVNHEATVGGKEPGGRLAELTRELDLTSDQVETISTALKATHAANPLQFEPTKGHAHVQGFATAFASETFDAKSINENANAHLAIHGAKRMAHFYQTVTPLLTPPQRHTLAEHLREHASHEPMSPAK